jgi:hypothetical protein
VELQREFSMQFEALLSLRSCVQTRSGAFLATIYRPKKYPVRQRIPTPGRMQQELAVRRTTALRLDKCIARQHIPLDSGSPKPLEQLATATARNRAPYLGSSLCLLAIDALQ